MHCRCGFDQRDEQAHRGNMGEGSEGNRRYRHVKRDQLISCTQGSVPDRTRNVPHGLECHSHADRRMRFSFYFPPRQESVSCESGKPTPLWHDFTVFDHVPNLIFDPSSRAWRPRSSSSERIRVGCYCRRRWGSTRFGFCLQLVEVVQKLTRILRPFQMVFELAFSAGLLTSPSASSGLLAVSVPAPAKLALAKWT